MLIRAKAENFRSFDDEAELVMVSSSKIRLNDSHVKRVNEAKVLKHAAVYGANAAGKSNLIDVFRFFRYVLSQGLSIATSNLYCRNKEENRKRASTFELQFTVGERAFAYGFSAVLSERKILEEWLYSLNRNEAVSLLERNASDGVPSSSIHFSKEDRMRFDMYAQDFAEEKSRLFLDELNRSKRYASDSEFQVFRDAYTWIMRNIVTMSPMEPPKDVRYLLSDGGINRAGELLSSFDTGIKELCQEPISDEAFLEVVSEDFLERIREDVDAKLRESAGGKIRGCLEGVDGFYFFDVDANGITNVSKLRLRHGNAIGLFDFEEESDGTRRLFDLMGILLDGGEDLVYVVDELERSLHPMLVRRFLELFMKQNAEGSRQLIFSTHEASIMDQSLFRRDEIWFVDRSSDGGSRLYSLDRFKERFDKDISKAYLDGRYGAVPVFSDLIAGGE